jgi:hypothetical protein
MRHEPAAQNPVLHCALSLHRLSSGHRSQWALPQSTTGSVPLRTPSSQVGAWQQRSAPRGQSALPHTPLAQSAPVSQPCPVVQLASQLPPQSAAVSSWF